MTDEGRGTTYGSLVTDHWSSDGCYACYACYAVVGRGSTYSRS